MVGSGGTPYFITPDERVAIWEAYLEYGSFSKVAKVLGRDRETVTRHIKCPEFEAFHAKAIEDASKAALGHLKQSTLTVAKDWVRASSVAADKGDHKPAKDLLIATGVVQTDQLPPQQGIVIVNGIDQQGQALPNPFMGAFAAHSERLGIGPRQGFDNKDAGECLAAGTVGFESSKGGESEPEHA